MKFKEAYLRLQEISRLLQSEEIIDIEELMKLQAEAKQCYELCEGLLKKATHEE